ncbi:adenylyltransferase/cytidyltransferase family protein [Clostridium sp. AN503]|uniref:adenylyltransferase/cytidyltransferase family protein n=1 Tax=Clostridium sp. AN503 TaxID=3160598 RepID=UPI00345AA548
MKKYKVGYTQGVYDMFHVGHLNLINNAKKYCEYLIVGINSDRLVREYKNKTPVISENNRCKIVENIRSVDQAIIVDTLDKTVVYKELGFDVIFIGSDWKGNLRWERTRIELEKLGVDLIFLPHTDGITSTDLRGKEKLKVKE